MITPAEQEYIRLAALGSDNKLQRAIDDEFHRLRREQYRWMENRYIEVPTASGPVRLMRWRHHSRDFPRTVFKCPLCRELHNWDSWWDQPRMWRADHHLKHLELGDLTTYADCSSLWLVRADVILATAARRLAFFDLETDERDSKKPREHWPICSICFREAAGQMVAFRVPANPTLFQLRMRSYGWERESWPQVPATAPAIAGEPALVHPECVCLQVPAPYFLR